MPKMSQHKNRRLKKPRRTGSYEDARELVGKTIREVSHLITDAKNNGDKIALWGLTFVWEDLIKSYHRIGNMKTTCKGDDLWKDNIL